MSWREETRVYEGLVRDALGMNVGGPACHPQRSRIEISWLNDWSRGMRTMEAEA